MTDAPENGKPADIAAPADPGLEPEQTNFFIGAGALFLIVIGVFLLIGGGICALASISRLFSGPWATGLEQTIQVLTVGVILPVGSLYVGRWLVRVGWRLFNGGK